MFERDYLTEIIGEFVQTVIRALANVRTGKDAEPSIREIEEAITNLTDMGPDGLLSLSPESFAMMLSISGLGDTASSYIPFALNALAEMYESKGDEAMAELRREQGAACAVSAGVSPDYVPEEFRNN